MFTTIVGRIVPMNTRPLWFIAAWHVRVRGCASLLSASVMIALVAGFASQTQASVRFSSGTNAFESRVRYKAEPGWEIPAGDWTLGVWDNNFQGDGGMLINGHSAPDAPKNTLNLCYDKTSGRFVVGGMDDEGNAFGGGGKVAGLSGALKGGYPGRVTGKFTPRLHIIRRRAGHSEYLVAEGGHAPVLVASEERPFGAGAGKGWFFGCASDWASLYDGDLEGVFFATVAVSDRDIALMAAGCKPTNAPSLNGHLHAYFPMETASLSEPANPLALPNAGSDPAIGLKRLGAVGKFADGPMLRGAVVENNTPDQIVEPTNVVALNSFQPFQIIRHLNGAADVAFTGFDYGIGAADIEIRFLDVEHATSTPWQTLVGGSAGEGVKIDATVSVPKGYWKTIEVRRVHSAGGTGDSNRPNRTWSRWAVGEVVVAWGDSIQGQVQGTSTAGRVTPNGFIAKYPSDYPNTIKGDTNPLSNGMWNLLRGTGMGGGTQGENEIANNLSVASHCCVGITVSWAGATRLAYWNGRLGSDPYNKSKALALANDGLNKPNIVTWVGNLASANYGDDFYQDLDLFKAVLDRDLGAGTWQLLLTPAPVVYDGSSARAVSIHTLRDACWRWVRDNPQCSMFAGVFVDHTTSDGVHPTSEAWNLMGPRWGNAAGYLRDQKTYADPRAGEIVSFHRDGDALIVKVKLYAGTALSLKKPTENVTGFTLSADDFATEIPISSAVLVDATTVRIVPQSLPAGPLKLRYLFGRPGTSGTKPEQQGVDNILYVNASPTNILAVLPIWGTKENHWALAEEAKH